MFNEDRVKDFQQKVNLIRVLLREKELSNLMITTIVNFSWLTGGRSFVNIADESSVGKILITINEVFLITTNNELARLQDEEIGDLNLKVIVYPWYESFDLQLLEEYGLQIDLVTDRELEDELSLLRSTLTELEIKRLRWLGRNSAQILEDCCKTVKVGDSENEIAGKLSQVFWSQGIVPLVLNIAADERAYQYRHPISTDKVLKKHLVCSICVKKWGLHVTCTRVVHFGPIEQELRDKHNAAMRIEAVAMVNSKNNMAIKDIFKKMKSIYEETGFNEEWKQHPIGGQIGFKPREYDVTPNMDIILKKNQAFCWNPTIQGTKSEDTILITADGSEIVTKTGNFDYVTVKVADKEIQRVDILIRKM